eukprot:TRINITY_DN61756_c0_g1_i1.p1 TRINITY_DN61756_c0_g1~~TRINITY_DN61756_c0_g1_i1.p1  ORF type:complete len:762 (+),score=158.40 TRINITY_DN61756_c0_g1_i1:28-2313(+)
MWVRRVFTSLSEHPAYLERLAAVSAVLRREVEDEEPEGSLAEGADCNENDVEWKDMQEDTRQLDKASCDQSGDWAGEEAEMNNLDEQGGAESTQLLPMPRGCCRWLLPSYCVTLPMPIAAVHAAQYLVWRYGSVRSGAQKAVLQNELNRQLSDDYLRLAERLHDKLQASTEQNSSLQSACEKTDYKDLKDEEWDPFGFTLCMIVCFNDLDVPEGPQLRLVRMLFEAVEAAGASLRPTHVAFAEKQGLHLSPGVLTELILRCSSCSAATKVSRESVPFASPDAKNTLASLVKNHYLKCESGDEPVKLSTAIRFIRTHELASLLDDEVLLEPVMSTFCSGVPQHAYNLGENDQELQVRIVSYAVRAGKRLAAGRLVERFGILGMDLEEVPSWLEETYETYGHFRKVCAACVKEAEDAEARDLRAANEQRMAAFASEDADCLQLPASVADQVILVSTSSQLEEAAALFAKLRAGDADRENLNAGGDVASLLAIRDRALGLDVEWRPTLEKRGGMQKHRRTSQASGKMEPCATLQVAAESFVHVFDLLELAHEHAPTAPALSALLKSLLDDPSFVKLGFGFRNDLQRLAASYPHLECFRRVQCVVDVQEAFLEARREGGQPSGLSALCMQHFGAPLSKRLQTSDWGSRPLTREQLLYAALDAHCLIGLARALPKDVPRQTTLEVKQTSSGQFLVYASSLGRDSNSSSAEHMEELTKVEAHIAAKGNEIRAMKAAGVAKATWQAEVAVLLQLKARYGELVTLLENS